MYNMLLCSSLSELMYRYNCCIMSPVDELSGGHLFKWSYFCAMLQQLNIIILKYLKGRKVGYGMKRVNVKCTKINIV